MKSPSSREAADVVPAVPKRGMTGIPIRVAKRAATRYVVDESGCWESVYSVASHGYAQIGWWENGHSRGTLCHRATWVWHHCNQIPEGMTVDHICHNRRCVNPEHLRLLPNYENARRTSGANWPIGECKHGHSNEYLTNIRGHWYCEICYRRWKSNGNKVQHAKHQEQRRTAA